MNKTVGKSDVSGFVLMFKAIQSNKVLGYLQTSILNGNVYNWDFESSSITFSINTNESLYSKLKTGQSYKIQLAYVSASNLIGYYSTVGIVKYTTNPKVEILSLQSGININPTTFYGRYSQENGDTTEKVYSYRFDVYDSDNVIYDTSGDQIHNSFEDESLTYSIDKFVLNKDLVVGKNYYIRYSIKTINNLEKATPKYRIIEQDTIDSELEAKLHAEMNWEEGYASLGLEGAVADDKEIAATGAFVLKRACSKDNFQTWQTIYKFKLANEYPSNWEWKDFLVEHGFKYKYAIQQTNSDGFYSNKIISEEIMASFEDMFLYDGERQLKVKYNPKISSFKDTILESKQNTLGNKYPFIFRNGVVRYKEFPVSGLISYWMDDEELFASKQDIFLEAKMTDLLDENFIAERLFKLKVLDFLNNGKPKVFRSPSEGNYIVQLLSSSLSPVETLGRMLHTFSATASEVAEFNYDNLVEYGFINTKQKDEKKFTNFVSVDLTKAANDNLLAHVPANYLKITSCTPGTEFQMTDDTSTKSIVIGVNGEYIIPMKQEAKIYSVILVSGNPNDGMLDYAYESDIPNTFNTVANIIATDYPCVQFLDGINDVIGYFENAEISIQAFTFIRAQARKVKNAWKQNPNNSEFYEDEACTKQITIFDPWAIYKVYIINNRVYSYYDGRDINKPIAIPFSNKLYINGDVMDLTETEKFEVKNPGKITRLATGNGIILECGLRTKIINYTSAVLGDEARQAREKWQQAEAAYRNLLFYNITTNSSYYQNGLATEAYFAALESAKAPLAGLKLDYLEKLKIALQKE